MRSFAQGWLDLVSCRTQGLLAALARAGLIAASVPYGLAMRARNRLYDWGWLRSKRAGVPVVVVGNLTVGGTGKTPAVEYLARFYCQLGRRVAILSRGYGVRDGRNDEALVLEANLDDVPHLQDADRVRAACTAVEELECDLLLLDDGFQHRRLQRDLNVVLLDVTRPWRWCLPGGLLREPRSGLRRADAVILTRSDQVTPEVLERTRARVAEYIPSKPIALARHAPVALQNLHAEQPPTALAGRTVAALCGIGNPHGFRATLLNCGATILDQRIFPDHHAYQRSDVAALDAWARTLPADTWLITTQKDWVKLRIDQLGGRPLWSFRIALDITQGRAALEAALLRVVHEPRSTTSECDGESSTGRAGDSFDSKDAYDPAIASAL